ERILVPVVDDADHVERDPDDDDHRLRRQVPAGPQEAGQALGEASEGVGIVRRATLGAAGGTGIVSACHQRLALSVRQQAGSLWSSTSSIVTAPTSRFDGSVTGTA